MKKLSIWKNVENKVCWEFSVEVKNRVWNQVYNQVDVQAINHLNKQ